MQEKKSRFYALDLLRGLAVFLMLLAHSVYFFSHRDSSLIISLENTGNVFCFTTFLLISGAVSYIAYLNHDLADSRKNRVIKRILALIVSYYLIAVFVELKSILHDDVWQKISILLDIITLRNLPSYTEYIVPFIIYPLIMFVFSDVFRKIAKNILLVVVFSTIFYLVGFLVYNLPFAGFFEPWKALVAGAEGYFRFPLLQYFPVFLLGLYWGRQLIRLENIKLKEQLVAKLGLLFAITFLLIWYFANALDVSAGEILRRWPPSLGFLAFSSSISFLVSYLIYKSKNFRSLPVLKDFLLILGQNAFAFFWAHVFLLTLYKFISGPQISSLLVFVIMFVLLIVVSLILATILPFNYRFVLCKVRGSCEEDEIRDSEVLKLEEEVLRGTKKELGFLRKFFFPAPDGTTKRKRLIKKRHILAGLVIGAVVAALVSPAIVEEVKTSIKNSRNASWWDDSYAYRQNINVVNTSTFSNISEGQTLKFQINHKKMVEAGESKADGGDIRMVYLAASGYKEIAFLVDSWGSEQTEITFNNQEIINGGSNDSLYFLYFGNTLASFEPGDFNLEPTPADYRVELSSTSTHAVLASVSKKWNLIEKDDGKLEVYGRPMVEVSKEATVRYRVLDTPLKGMMVVNSEGFFEAQIQISSLKAGTYQVQIELNDNGNILLSQKVGFYVSYPLYITWTYDWEGYDVSGAYLKASEDISREYGVPITHFFNPRIFTTSTITPDRAQYLTDWLRNRMNIGDGYGLHLHMFYDFVELSGVTPKKEPRWDKAEGDGYSVLTSAYSKDELKQIISKAMSELENQGLPEPEIYRAGGWFSNIETLKALEELGFGADSSGRTAYKFGQNSIAGHWDLSPLSQPYFPSRTDQNAPSLSNHLNLLEIPNNGTDSYWFSASEMIERFNANFTNQPLKEKKQLTYLSHPHWFKQSEQSRIRELFGYIAKYNNSSDSGPVIYVTSQEILDIWTK